MPAISMTKSSLYKQIFIMAMPLMLSNLFQQFYSIADAIIVGNFVGKEALGAVGSSGTLSLILIYFFIGLSTGASICASQAYGGHNRRRMQGYVNTAMGLSLVAGVFIALVGIIFCPTFFSWLNLKGKVLEEAITYGRIFFCGMVPMLIYNMGSGIVRATGRTKVIMYALMVACLSNIALDLLFVAGLNWGVAGAGWATVAAQTLAAAIIVVSMAKTEDIHRLTLKHITIKYKELKEIVRIGAPAGVQSVVQSFSNICFQANINTYGASATAALTSFNKVDGFIYLPGDSIALSASVVTGHRIGGGRAREVRPIFKTAALMAVAITGLICLGIYLGWQPLFSLFTQDADVLTYTGEMVAFMIPLYVFYVMNQIFAGVIRGTGEAKIPMIIVLVFTCGFRVTWNLAVPHLTGDIRAIYLCYPLSWIITFIAYSLYYAKGGWLKKHIIKGESTDL